MNEDVKIEAGPGGEPIVRPSLKEMLGDLMPKDDGVEVLPGIMVSQRLINDAIGATSDVHAIEELARQRTLERKLKEEIREDLDAARQVLASMMERARTPLNMQEKYVSFDAMPSPLQRVVKAYIDAAAANKELSEAIEALRIEPPTSP